MKKYLVLLLALVLTLALFCACGTENPPEAESAAPQKSVTPDYGELYFASGDVKFGIFDEAEPVLSALGEPINGTFESNSCAYQGKDYFYYYDGFELMVNDIDGVRRITGITLADDTVANPQGVKIGMDINKALELMDMEYTQNGSVYKLVSGSAMLIIRAADDGSLAAAEYTAYAEQ